MIPHSPLDHAHEDALAAMFHNRPDILLPEQKQLAEVQHHVREERHAAHSEVWAVTPGVIASPEIPQ